MGISVGAESVYNEVQHPFMIKMEQTRIRREPP